MGIETGVEKSNGHPTPGEALVCVHSQRRRQYVIGLVKNNIVRIDLRLGAAKELGTASANLGQIARRVRVCFKKCRDVGRQRVEEYALISQVATEVTASFSLREI